MALRDDPVLLRRPLGFARRVNAAEDSDVDDLRERLPGRPIPSSRARSTRAKRSDGATIAGRTARSASGAMT
jgi:hypothetical protein